VNSVDFIEHKNNKHTTGKLMADIFGAGKQQYTPLLNRHPQLTRKFN
jgi:hypothetical protein